MATGELLDDLSPTPFQRWTSYVPDSERFRHTPKTCGRFPGILSLL
jgi:hypothetical protein